MAAATLPAHDALLPRPPGGNGAGAALALLVHLGLLLALTTAVDWRARTPETVSAELWAAVPQVAAPPTPEPQPAPAPQPPAPLARVEAPREADIALEKARQRQAQIKAYEQKRQAEEDLRKQEAERKKTAEAQKKERERQAQEARAEQERVAQQREANLRRIMGQAGGSTGTAAHNAGPSGTYAGKLIGAIRRNIVFAGTLSGNPVATVEVTAAPGGSIISRRLIKSSGHKDWDEAVLRAVERTGSLPRDVDGRVPSPVTIDFSFRD